MKYLKAVLWVSEMQEFVQNFWITVNFVNFVCVDHSELSTFSDVHEILKLAVIEFA